MEIALKLAELSTCPKRSVGCILLDSDMHIIGSGYNGMPSGWDNNCEDEFVVNLKYFTDLYFEKLN